MLALTWFVFSYLFLFLFIIFVITVLLMVYLILQFMVPLNYTEFIDGLTHLVKNEFIPMSRVDDAVQRILRVKFTMGLFETPLADYSMAKYLGCQVAKSNLFRV